VTVKTGRRTGLVLIHGRAHTASCWDLVINEMQGRASNLPVLAVDLPGRSCPAGQRAGVTIDSYAESVISAVARAELDDVVLVVLRTRELSATTSAATASARGPVCGGRSGRAVLRNASTMRNIS
jgi:hypothetical protein